MSEQSAESNGENSVKRLRNHRSPFIEWIRETSIVLVMAMLLSVGLRTFVFQAFYVPSVSMQDTLMRNDRIIASKITKHLTTINRGDIIVFADPSDWLPDISPESGWRGKLIEILTWVGVLPSNSGQDLVKRVIAVGGDHVACCDAQGGITVNGYSLDESSYAIGRSDIVKFDVVVPADHYFVMGDNREFSSDSRYHLDEDFGTIADGQVVGQVTALIWPFNRFGTMKNPLADQPIPAAK